jgi:hypothetical protein
VVNVEKLFDETSSQYSVAPEEGFQFAVKDVEVMLVAEVATGATSTGLIVTESVAAGIPPSKIATPPFGPGPHVTVTL